MASTKLRLLLDESITDQLATLIMGLAQSAVYVRHNSVIKGRDDSEVAAFADSDKRIVVALDGDFKRTVIAKYGVIKLKKARNDDECLFAIFRAFWHSGHRSRAKRKRTFLTHEGIRIENGTPFEEKWPEQPCPNRTARTG
jgi:hypothetical protein